MNFFRTTLALAFLALSAVSQTDVRQAAIKQYLDGNDLEAIIQLEALIKQKQYAADAELINYLGLAYQNGQDAKGARKMFEKAVKLDPAKSTYRSNLAYVYLLERKIDRSQQQAEKALELDAKNMAAYYVIGKADLWERKTESAMATAEKMMSADPGFPPGYMLKSEALIAALGKRLVEGSTIRGEVGLLKESADVLATGVRNIKYPAYQKVILERLESMNAFYDYYSRDRTSPTAIPAIPEPGVTPVKILSKPHAKYTDSARSAGVQGSIRLAVLLGANGKIMHVLKLVGLGYGLDEQAIAAATKIVFQPKMKDGVPVSTVVTLEYSFSIY